MSVRPKTTRMHPDDFMVVTVSLEFRAKPNPEVGDSRPFEITELRSTSSAGEAEDYLQKIVNAIKERRLYGFMAQDVAEGAIGAGDWIGKDDD